MKQQKDNWVKILFSFAAPCKGKMALSVFCAILSVAGGFIPFWAVYEILLAFINQNVTLNGILIWCLVGAAGYLLRVACHGISTILAHISAYTILEGIRLKIADRLMKAPLGEVMGRRIGYLKNIIMDKVEDLEPPLAHMIPELTSNLLLPVAIFIWMLVIDWRMGLAVLIAPVLAMIPMFFLMRNYNSQYAAYMEANNHVNSIIIEYVEGIEVVKAFNQSTSSYEKFVNAVQSFKEFTLAWFKSTWKSMNLMMAIMPTTLLGVLPVGLLLVQNGSISPAELNFLLSYLRAVLQESIGYEVAAGQRIHLGDVLKRVPLGYFSKNSVGDILTGVTTELSTLELQGMKMVDIIINGYAKFIAILLCFLFLSPAAAVISVVGVAFSSLALHGISRHSEKTAAITHQAMEDMSGSAIEYIRGLSIVKSFGQEGASIESFRKANTDLKNIHIKVEKGYTPFNCLHLFSLKLASMGIVFICAWQTLNGQMSLAYFLMFVLFSFVIFGSVENINDAAHMLGLIDSAMNKLEALENAEYIDQDGKDITPTSYDITFQDVSFGYDKRTVLHDVNFTIPQNTTTAIVGPSGSGKSTLCSLIARFYDVDAGKITLGETDIREFTCDSLLKNISMVFQNVYLFRDTIRNNIKFGSPDASEEQMIAAAKEARCHDFIMALPDGYDTVIGEGGSSLSGGEKQRISIARAMLKDAPIVILDEATASIDPENEHLIQEAISALTHGKTIITIAHRLATIENADQILVIDGGTVVQKGTHKELLAQRGTYQEFIKIREQAEGWRIQQ